MQSEGVVRMDGNRFDVLMGVLKILEKKRNPEVVDSVLEIIDAYDDTLTQEQKAAILKNFLEFRKHHDIEEEARWEKQREEALKIEQQRALLKPDFSLY